MKRFEDWMSIMMLVKLSLSRMKLLRSK